MDNNPFKIPNLNCLNEPSQMFFPNNSSNKKNENLFNFLNNNGNNNTNFNINSTNTDNRIKDNPFFKAFTNPFKKELSSNQNSDLNNNKEEKSDNIFIRMGESEKKKKNENNNAFPSFKPDIKLDNNSNTDKPNSFFSNINTQTITSPNFNQFQDNKFQPQLNLNSQNVNSNKEIPFPSTNNNPFLSSNNINILNSLNLQDKNEKEKEVKNMINNTNNNIEKNKSSISPKKQLEIIKEEEELKLKKESSTKEALTIDNFLIFLQI